MCIYRTFVGTGKNSKMLSSRYLQHILALMALVAHVAAQVGGGCPEPYGVQTYPDDKYCDRFYLVSFITSLPLYCVQKLNLLNF